ncbi:hypothetical protein RHDE110596_14950 [Prescottella defluvii]
MSKTPRSLNRYHARIIENGIDAEVRDRNKHDPAARCHRNIAVAPITIRTLPVCEALTTPDFHRHELGVSLVLTNIVKSKFRSENAQGWHFASTLPLTDLPSGLFDADDVGRFGRWVQSKLHQDLIRNVIARAEHRLPRRNAIGICLP